jgi:hypothetical protein
MGGINERYKGQEKNEIILLHCVPLAITNKTLLKNFTIVTEYEAGSILYGELILDFKRPEVVETKEKHVAR